MSATGTTTTTFTVADIRKVVENFAADYAMIADVTGLRSRDKVANDVSDLNAFAADGYLESVTLSLLDSSGVSVNVAVYKVSRNATGWQIGSPGNNLWPVTPGGSLWLLATLNNTWWNKSDAQKEEYIKDSGLHSPWSKTDKKALLAGLNSSEGQKYASNGYGWARTNYSK